MSRVVVVFLLLLVQGFSPHTVASEAQEKVLFLVTDADRLVASNTLYSRFDPLNFHAKERILKKEVAAAVAVVVTNQRVIAYGAYAPGWQSVPIIAQEEVESVVAEDSSVQIVTTDRLLNFNGRRGAWAITRRTIKP